MRVIDRTNIPWPVVEHYSLDVVLTGYQQCRKCDSAVANKAALFSGSLESEYVFVGRAPDLYISRRGIAYARALDAYASALGAQFYSFLNLVGCYDHLTPSTVSNCFEYKVRLWHFLPNVKVVILLGIEAYQQFLREEVFRFRDVERNILLMEIGGRKTYVLPLSSNLYTASHRQRFAECLRFLELVRKEIENENKKSAVGVNGLGVTKTSG